MEVASLERSLNRDERKLLQDALVWAGTYRMWIDGVFGSGTRAAIRGFQDQHGYADTGYLAPDEIVALLDIRTSVRDEQLRWREFEDPDTGILLGLPTALFNRHKIIDNGGAWATSTDDAFLFTHRVLNKSKDDFLFFYVLTLNTATNVTINYQADNMFIVRGLISGTWESYIRYEFHDGEIRGYSLQWLSTPGNRWDAISVAISNSFWPFGKPSQPASVYPTLDALISSANDSPDAGAPATAPDLTLVRTGTGFIVSADGVVVTNEHVVDGCGEVRAAGHVADVMASDATNDLALLKLPQPGDMAQPPYEVATLRAGSTVSLGEDVVAAGYPLSGILDNDLNITPGIVSATSGIGGDPRYIQITTPVQPGNSGGPLLDRSGDVIGVVSAKLDWVAASEASGALPENVNFAVRAPLLTALLIANGVDFNEATLAVPAPTTQIAAAARGFTVHVECWRSAS